MSSGNESFLLSSGKGGGMYIQEEVGGGNFSELLGEGDGGGRVGN